MIDTGTTLARRLERYRGGERTPAGAIERPATAASARPRSPNGWRPRSTARS